MCGTEALAIEARFATAIFMIQNRNLIESDAERSGYDVLYDGGFSRLNILDSYVVLI